MEQASWASPPTVPPGGGGRGAATPRTIADLDAEIERRRSELSEARRANRQTSRQDAAPPYPGAMQHPQHTNSRAASASTSPNPFASSSSSPAPPSMYTNGASQVINNPNNSGNNAAAFFETQQRLARAEADLGKERQRATFLEQQLAQAQAQAQAQYHTQAAAPAQTAAQYEELQATLLRAEQERSALEESLQDAETRLLMNSQQMRTQATQLNDKAAQIAQLEREVESLQATLQDTTNNTFSTNASANESVLEEANSTIYKWQESYQQLQQEYYANYARIAEDKAALEEEKAALEEELRQVQARAAKAEDNERRLENESKAAKDVPSKMTVPGFARPATGIANESEPPLTQRQQPQQQQQTQTQALTPPMMATAAPTFIPPSSIDSSTAPSVSEQTGLRNRHQGSGPGGNTGMISENNGTESKATPQQPLPLPLPLPLRATRTSFCRLFYLLLLALSKAALLIFLVSYILVVLDVDGLILQPRNSSNKEDADSRPTLALTPIIIPLLSPALNSARDTHSAVAAISTLSDAAAVFASVVAAISASGSHGWEVVTSGHYFQDTLKSLTRLPKELLDAVLMMK